MYFVVNKGVGMDTGKIAAQVAHATFQAALALLGEEKHKDEILFWFESGAPKIILKASAAEFERLLSLHPDVVISDAGKTQVPAGTKTVLLWQPTSSVPKELTMLKLL